MNCHLLLIISDINIDYVHIITINICLLITKGEFMEPSMYTDLILK